jgi:NRAMP (natural resistance-associated macrophage protein)-like metal ion transporter
MSSIRATADERTRHLAVHRHELARRRLLHRRLPHHRRRAWLRGHGYFKRLGPGLVTGAADDDPSGIGTYSQVGAEFGLGLAWSALYVAPLAAGVQEMAARLGLTRGKGLSTLLRERFPRPVLYFAVALVTFANTFNIAADIAAMGASAKLIVPIPASVLSIGLTALILTLEITIPYHHYCKFLRWLALSLLAYLFVLASIHVDWGKVADHVFLPHFSGSPAELAALVAVFGTTVSPYLFFWQASEEVEEETEHPDAAPPNDDNMRAMRIDVIGGMVSACIIAFAIIVSAAATLHASGITNITTADQAAEALQPFAGDLAGLVFAIGVVGLGMLAIPVLAGSTAYAASEALSWHEGLSKRLREARGFYAVITVSMLIGLGLDFAGMDPIRGLFYAAIVNGIAAPPLIFLMIVLARSPEMGARRSGRLSLVVCGAALAISVALPIAWLLS